MNPRPWLWMGGDNGEIFRQMDLQNSSQLCLRRDPLPPTPRSLPPAAVATIALPRQPFPTWFHGEMVRNRRRISARGAAILAEGSSPPCCKCRAIASKFVAFEGWQTGRRFLGCAGQGEESCDFVEWVDPVWPPSLQKAVGKLWDMYGEVKSGRVNDALDYMERKFKYQDEITKLHRDLRIVQDEVNKVVEEKQVTLALKAKAEQALIEVRSELEQKKKLDAAASNMHKVLRIKAEKERDKFKEDKRKLEFMIADLLRQKEGSRAKLRKIAELCDEKNQ